MSQARQAVSRSPRQRIHQPRQLTERQIRKLLDAVLAEIEALASSHQLSAAQLRYRLLLLQRQLRETVARWPAGYVMK